MSYQRSPHVLKYFDSISRYYVWSDGETITDYGVQYNHDPSFIELLGHFILDATSDEKYALKIMTILSKKLGCHDILREHPLSIEEWFKQDDLFHKALQDKKTMTLFFALMHWDELQDEDIFIYELRNSHKTR